MAPSGVPLQNCLPQMTSALCLRGLCIKGPLCRVAIKYRNMWGFIPQWLFGLPVGVKCCFLSFLIHFSLIIVEKTKSFGPFAATFHFFLLSCPSWLLAGEVQHLWPQRGCVHLQRIFRRLDLDDPELPWLWTRLLVADPTVDTLPQGFISCVSISLYLSALVGLEPHASFLSDPQAASHPVQISLIFLKKQLMFLLWVNVTDV